MSVHVTAPMLAAYNHFLAVGFTENGAAAAVGNFCQESGELLVATMFRAHPDASGGVAEALKSGGIAEWLGDRKTSYIAFSGRAETRLGLARGSLLNDLGTQCDFVVYELQTERSYAALYQQLTSGSKSIVNLTANFMMVYERPKLGPTANLDNRIAHAEAVVRVARSLRAPAPAPQIPVPQAQFPAPTVPPAPADLPPISASGDGFDAAALDHFGAMLDFLVKQRAEIERRITAIEAVAEAFGKSPGVPSSTPLQIPAADSAVPLSQRTNRMFGPNWQTSLSGIGALLGAAAGIAHSVSIGQMPDATQMGVLFAAVSAGVGLLQAKDKAVTGGTIPATPEAKRRVGA